MRAFVLFCLVAATFVVVTNAFGPAKPKPKNDYIERFKDIAAIEKDRSGIPIAIKLSQGILESSWGDGSLARESNNHFGIKCHNWAGSSMQFKDDDYDQLGNLIPSCFRVYDDASGSFIDHTDFLMSRKRYKSLFNITNNNYREWAFGLKDAGYATDSAYAFKLIGIIEKYELWRYDGLSAPIGEDNSILAIVPLEETPTVTTSVPTEDKKISRAKVRESEPIKDDELFEEGASEQKILEKEKHNFKNIPKSIKIPDGYIRGQGKKLFDQAVKKAKEFKKPKPKTEEFLEPIVPEKEDFRARGIDSENTKNTNQTKLQSYKDKKVIRKDK